MEELLYGIYLKLPDVQYLTANDVNSIAKLNDLVLDADLLTAGSVGDAVADIKGNVPTAGDTLEKLYNIISGLGNLKSEDIDTLAELNAILVDADVVSSSDLSTAMSAVWGVNGNAFGSAKKFGTTDNFPIAFITNNIERGRIAEQGQLILGSNALVPGFEVYKLQIKDDNALAVSGNAFFENGYFFFNLGKVGSPTVKQFRINTYVASLGGFDFTISANNPNASLEIADSSFGGTRPEMIRLTPGGYANTGILIVPNAYNMAFGYRYLLEATNPGQQSRNLYAFQAQINWSIDDAFPGYNQAHLFAAESLVTNHTIDGFFANVSTLNPAAEAYGFRSRGAKNFLDGNGMKHFLPVLKITTDSTAHPSALIDLMDGTSVLSTALYLSPLGSGRSGLIISPGVANSHGLFIGPQQALSSNNFDGYLAWLQYSTGGANMMASTDKPMLFIRKYAAALHGFDHSGAFIRMEEFIGSTGPFIEAHTYNDEAGALELKFSVDRDGVVSIGQLFSNPQGIDGVGRLYFLGSALKIITPFGAVKTVTVT
jgi:hypothetical protein